MNIGSLTIENIEPALEEQLRRRAARNRRSMEAELRHILSEAVSAEQSHETDLAEAIRRRFEPFGGVDDLQPHPPVTPGDRPAIER